MKRKPYKILISQGCSKKCMFSFTKTSIMGGGPFIHLFLTKDEYENLKNIIYDDFVYKFNENRSAYIPKEVIMDQLYKKARWLFEDEEQ